MKYPAIILLYCLAFQAKAQYILHGRVVDDRTAEPLAFVHIVAEGLREGTTTDIDGRFKLDSAVPQATLRFSYVGYAPMLADVVAQEAATIRMKRIAAELATVEILPSENPAHRIIQRVYAARKLNDGLRNRSHRYTAYSKTILTAALDSAILNDPGRMELLDSSQRRLVDHIERQHLLMIESATRRSFDPPAAEKEEVLAMRISGLKDPSLLAMAASTRTFSVYEPQITIDDRTYLSPIGPASTDRYLFILEDTLYSGRDSVYVIRFQPRSGRKFNGLKGLLYVHTDGYALQNVITEPVERQGNMNFKIQQQFERQPGSIWFPVQFNTFLYFDNVSINGHSLFVIGRTYLKEIEVDVPIIRKEVRGPDLVLRKEAVRRDDAIWEGLREAPLDERELNTYHTMDSIGEVHALDRKLKWFSTLSSGRLSTGPVDLYIDRFLHYNRHEGLRVGAGAITNDRISRHVAVGGYAAYGFGDEELKYGTELVLRPMPARSLRFRAHYSDDVAESAAIPIPQQPWDLLTGSLRWMFVDRMDRMRRTGGEFLLRLSGPLALKVGAEQQVRTDLLGYRYARTLTEGMEFRQAEFTAGLAHVGIEYAFGRSLVRLPDRELLLPSRGLVVNFVGSRAISGLWNGELAFWRHFIMVQKVFRLRMLGDLGVNINAAMVTGDVPHPYLFAMRGTNDPAIPIAVPNTFETMRPNEFLADRYVAMHLRHDLGHLLFKGKRFRPRPVIVGNMAIGRLESPRSHEGYAFNTLGNGYFEAGLQLDALLRMSFLAFGAGAYTRLGDHRYPDQWENMAFKVTLTMAR